MNNTETGVSVHLTVQILRAIRQAGGVWLMDALNTGVTCTCNSCWLCAFRAAETLQVGGEPPTQIFTQGALRYAAEAGWAARIGDTPRMEQAATAARQAYEEEIRAGSPTDRVMGALDDLQKVAKIAHLESEVHRLQNVVCDHPACTAPIIRHDDGHRVCAAGHGARWVTNDLLQKAETRAGDTLQILHTLVSACSGQAWDPGTPWQARIGDALRLANDHIDAVNKSHE